MPTSSKVGSLALPLTAAGAGTALTDPTIELLLAFVGHVLTADIDPKLADLAGTATASCPADKRFGYAPDEPRGHIVKLPVPSLWCWWDGQSAVVPWTQLIAHRRRNLQLLYCFPELPGRDATEDRRGLMAAVDAALTRAFRHQRHETFAYNGKAQGTLLGELLGDEEQLRIDWLGGRGLPRIGVDDANQARTVRKPSGRDFPAYAAIIEVRERIDWLDGAAEAADATTTIKHDDVELFERHVLPPEPDDDVSDEL